MLAEKRSRVRLDGEAGDIEIALLDWGGDGPLALLHHANGFCAGLWAEVAEGLRSRFRVVAMDARGHGDSTRPEGAQAYRWPTLASDAARVAEHLLAETSAETGGDRVALGLGHSFGGTLLIAAAAQRPGLFQRLLLLDPVILPPAALASSRPLAGVGLAERARKRRHVFGSRQEARNYFAERELFERFTPGALDLYVHEGLRERQDGKFELKCSGEVEATIFEGGRTLDVFAEAPKATLPALLLWAQQGNFPRAVYEALADVLPDAAVEDVDAGHLVPMEQPGKVVEIALRLGMG